MRKKRKVPGWTLPVLLLAWLPAWGQSRELEVHGFVSQGYLDSSEHDFWAPTRGGTFEFSEIGLNLSKKFRDDLRVGIQFFARDLGDLGNHEVEIDWALGEYRPRDEFGIRIGKIKQPHGLYNQERDVDLLRSQIFLPQSVYPEGTRELVLAFQGLSIFGTLAGVLEYEFYTGSRDLDEENPGLTTTLLVLNQFRPYLNPSMTNDSLYGGALRWETPLEGMRLGVSWHEQDISASVVQLNGIPQNFDLEGLSQIVLSMEYETGSWMVNGEWTENFVADDSLPGEPAGWYVGGSYRINNRFEVNANHNEFYGFKDDKDGSAFEPLGLPGYLVFQKDTSLGVRVDFNDSWLLKVQYNQVEGLGLISAYDLLNRDNTGEPDWHYVGVKATYHF
ncbi:MAG: hypothetical protein QNK37_02635 [Acidobacteriota bacterium]|nr:hypothetical protein [Acidobacteriota bacterium]